MLLNTMTVNAFFLEKICKMHLRSFFVVANVCCKFVTAAYKFHKNYNLLQTEKYYYFIHRYTAVKNLSLNLWILVIGFIYCVLLVFSHFPIWITGFGIRTEREHQTWSEELWLLGINSWSSRIKANADTHSLMNREKEKRIEREGSSCAVCWEQCHCSCLLCRLTSKSLEFN